MSKVTIRDFLLKLGFDSRDVDKGLKRVDGEVMKLNKKIQNQATTLNRINNKNSKHQDKKLRDMRTENNLLKKKQAIVEGIAKKVKDSQPKPVIVPPKIFKPILPKDKRPLGMTDEQIELRRARQQTTAREQGKNLAYNARGGVGGKATQAELDAVNKKLVEYRKNLRQLEQQSAVAKTKREFAMLDIEMRKVRGETGRLLRSQKELTRELTKQQFVSNALRDSFRNLGRSYVSAFAIIGGSGMAAATGQDLVSIRTSFLAATGSAEEAAKSFEFVKQTSLALGVDLQATAKGYNRISFAAKEAGLSVEDSKMILLSAAEASTAFGLSTDDTAGVLRAFDQILSKGSVQAEELRGQLGDRLTGAFYTAADAMGVTTVELNKMLKAGQVGSKEFIIPFAEQLRQVVRNGDALSESLKTSRVGLLRFGTAFKLNILEAFDAGAEKGLGKFFNSLSQVTKGTAPWFRTLGKAVGFLAESFGLVLQMVTQLIRPLGMLIDGVFSLGGSADKTTESFSGLQLVLKSIKWLLESIVGTIILPFALIEASLDKVQGKVDNIRKGKISPMEGFLDVSRDIVSYGANFIGRGAGAFGFEDTQKSLQAYANKVQSHSASNQIRNGDVTIHVDGSKDPETTAKEIQKIVAKEWDWKIQSAMVGG